MSRPWRLARSLEVLRSELRSRWPGTTFWTIGDDNHGEWSDHSPNAAGVVCAADILGDGGMDLDWFAEYIRTCGHRDLDYVIHRDRIASAGGPWRNYFGAYHSHVHVSVGDGPDGHATGGYDHTDPWGIASSGHHALPTLGGIMLPRHGDSGPEVGYWQRILTELGEDLPRYGVDEDYGDETAKAVRSWYYKHPGTDGDDYDGRAITSWVALHLQMEAFQGKPGPRGPKGNDGKDGVLELPVDVEITGRITSLGSGA